jgi:hypothetical protein
MRDKIDKGVGRKQEGSLRNPSGLQYIKGCIKVGTAIIGGLVMLTAHATR